MIIDQVNKDINCATNEFPLEWRVITVGEAVQKIVGGGTPARENDYFYQGTIPWVTVKDMDGSFYKDNAIEHITDEAIQQSSSNLISPYQVIVATRIGLGRGFINTKPVAINQDLKALYLKDDVEKNFFLYWYLSQKDKIEGMGTGSTVKGIRLEQLKSLELHLPPFEEQQKIAEILSTADQQIEKTDQLIEKTKELKKGLMQHLLTKGIGHTEFKQTELGEIPVEWEIVNMVDLMESGSDGVKRGPFGGALKKDIFVTNGYAVYEQQHVIYNQFKEIRYFINQEKYDELSAFSVNPNDVLISCSGTVGKIAVVPSGIKPGVMNQALLRFRAKLNYVDTKFLYYMLTSENMQSKMLDMTHGSTIKNIVAVSEIKKIKVVLPSLKEQQKIAEILSTVDTQIENYENEKSKLLELKKGLMHQLLTGKVRVTV